MDLAYYRQRERTELGLADQARSDAARRAHLELAASYRAVIEAYEQVDALRRPHHV